MPLRDSDDAHHPEDGSGPRTRGPRGTSKSGGEFIWTREANRVNTGKSGSDIANHIRHKVVYEGLELEEIGIDLADITDDVPLFDEEGLDLDSIDALEILAGVQREFGLSLPNVDQAFIEEHCATVGRLARMVVDMSRDSGDWRQSPDEVAAPPSSDATDEESRIGSSADS